jgi:hypothetical protein
VRAARIGRSELLGDLDCFFETGTVDDVKPEQLLLGFREWPVDHERLLAFFSHQQFPYSTLFDGRFVPAGDLPWDYLPTYIVLALPELVLALNSPHDRPELRHDGVVVFLAPRAGNLLVVVAKYCILHIGLPQLSHPKDD